MVLEKKNILLGVSGGIAAYKSAELVRGMIKKKATVRVVMSENATRFVSPLTFETLSQNYVYTDLWEKTSKEIDHVALSAMSDMFLIAPATANTIGKIANGLADNLLTNLFLTFRGPTIICPSMNSKMYLNFAVQSNLETLRSRGIHIMGPDSGELACGDEGVGRLPDTGLIIRELESLLKRKGELSGKKVLITAGPTREFFDAVRFISNPSSGKMGYAIAEEAVFRGADVTLISGPTLLPKPTGVRLFNTVTADEMNAVTMKCSEDVDVAIMTAAVSDYKPVRCLPEKIKKTKKIIACDLIPTPDILEGMGQRKNGIFLVGFAAETNNLLENMRKKMLRKNCSLMVGNLVNSPQSGFESDNNEISILSRKNDRVDILPLMPKREAAAKIIDKIIEESGA